MLNKDIRISKKHGINPTIPLCFWCGKEKNEIALLGKLPGDIEAPRSMWLLGDYEPCCDCKLMRSQGVDLIEVSEYPIVHPQQPSFHGAYPTGRHMILKERAIRSIFSPEVAEQLCEKRIGFIDSETLSTLQAIFEKENEELGGVDRGITY